MPSVPPATYRPSFLLQTTSSSLCAFIRRTILSDIRTANLRTKNHKLNRAMQAMLFGMVERRGLRRPGQAECHRGAPEATARRRCGPSSSRRSSGARASQQPPDVRREAVRHPEQVRQALLARPQDPHHVAPLARQRLHVHHEVPRVPPAPHPRHPRRARPVCALLHPARHVVRKFAQEFGHPGDGTGVIAAGTNAIREVCRRQPWSMEEDLLRVGDLVEYRKSRDKAVTEAVRGLLQLFREVNPGMLKRRGQGKEASTGVAKSSKPLPFGHSAQAAVDIEGLVLLEDHLKKLCEVEGVASGEEE
ncbi:hypothetical protein FKP32DRAFT_1595215 [Trametes sanguinea]|nr:hypothetical protein FKP32DRAFT_1595215 [Trametes sanguinea]